MPVKYIPYFPNTIEGQAILNNFTRTQRTLKYRDNDRVLTRILRGMPLYELEPIEKVGENPNGNLVIRGECVSACAYLKEKGIKVDLVYIDPPFASGANYAKKIYIRRNPKVAEAITKAEEELKDEELKSFEEKMYGDIWTKEAYLNWMYENLVAIKSVMGESGSIYVHLDWHIGHYVKVLMDEIFGEGNFVDEVIWCYGSPSGGRSKGAKFVKNHDTIYHFARNYDLRKENKLFTPYSEKYIKDWFKNEDADGRKYQKRERGKDENGKVIWEKQYLDESLGVPLSTVWTDILTVYADPRAFTGKHSTELDSEYETQKPEALLARIISASSDKDMLIADFFGGSGVAAKVASDLGRKFIHVDVGINSIQTTRDRLIAAGASFDVLEVKDGVALFRNPAQTMDKLRELIPGLGASDGVGRFWAGAIHDSKLGIVPVYLPNLLDHAEKLLDKPLMNRILQEAMPDLPDGVRRVVVYYIDAEDMPSLEKFIAEVNPTEIAVELRDLKQVLHEVVVNDIVEYNSSEHEGQYVIEIIKFISDRLMQKIDYYDQKRSLNGKLKQKELTESNDEEDENGNGDQNGEEKAKPTPITPIHISDDGLELIELVSVDCQSADGFWHSDAEIKIDKNGYVILNGTKTRSFWDAKITISQKPLRLKVRNIAGDETVIML